MSRAGDTFGLLKETGAEFMADDCLQMSAALAYYAMFSLAPIVLLIIWIAGLVLDPSMVEGELRETLTTSLGEQGAKQVITMVEILGEDPPGASLTGALATGTLIFGATGLIYQLQRALNRTWAVAPAPGRGLRVLVGKRLASAAMLLFGAAPLMLLSIVASAALAALTGPFSKLLPGVLAGPLLGGLELGLSLSLLALMFASIFKFLPDAHIKWKPALIGGFATAVLYLLGESGISYYLGRSSVGSAFGAASSLAVLLVWVYYSSLSLLIGAELTQVYCRRRGGGIIPRAGAVRVESNLVGTEPSEGP